MKMSLDDRESENDRIQLLFVEVYNLYSAAGLITKHIERDSPTPFLSYFADMQNKNGACTQLLFH